MSAFKGSIDLGKRLGIVFWTIFILGCDVQPENAPFSYRNNSDGTPAEGSDLKQTGTEVGNGSPHAADSEGDGSDNDAVTSSDGQKSPAPAGTGGGTDEIPTDGIVMPGDIVGTTKDKFPKNDSESTSPAGGGSKGTEAETTANSVMADKLSPEFVAKVYRVLFKGPLADGSGQRASISSAIAAEACTKVSTAYVSELDENADGVLSSTEQKAIKAALLSILAKGQAVPAACK
jgi:hypothetical protein